MTFERRVRHYSPGPNDYVGEISTQAISGCWFELHRRGGCGVGELVLKNDFADRYQIEIGDWISFEPESGTRWYLGRVEERESRSPAGVLCRLTGMAVELGEIFPGGFSRTVAYNVPPHRFAQTDLFPGDPDYSEETVDVVSQTADLVWLLIQRYAAGVTHIEFDAEKFSPLVVDSPVMSVKFRGEESLRSIFKELAMRNRDAAWGVNAKGAFYFRPSGTTVQTTLREGDNLLSLREVRNLDQVYNRLLLTGDYIYDGELNSEVPAAGFYRWRGTYVQPFSRGQYGDRRIRMWIPWIRSQTDAHQFVREFFRVYARPTSRYEIEVAGMENLIFPWAGAVRLEDRDGNELVTAAVETVRVQFDAVPRYELSVGPEAPQELWPEPEHDERWELNGLGGGGVVTFSSEGSSDGGSLSSGDNSDESSEEDSSEEVSSSEVSSSDAMSSSLSSGSDLTGSSSGLWSSSGSDGISSGETEETELSSSDSAEESDSDTDSTGESSGSGDSSGLSSGEASSTTSNSSGESFSSDWSGWSSGSGGVSSGSDLCAEAILDNFVDTNGTALSSHQPDIAPSGVVWADSNSGFKIFSGCAQFKTIGSGSGIAYLGNGETNVVVSASVQAGTLLFRGDIEWLGSVGLVLRVASINTYYAALVSASSLRLVKVTGGTASILDTQAVSLAPGATFTISAECNGSTITATTEGVTVSTTGVTLTSAAFGLYANNDDDAETPHEFESFQINCL
ncbi:hypothetical protein Pla110_06890 [Polystyrenella longa]|uniref:Uncharacterized protein n=1 Tax=Polystyrenella longa TaxID=2528007 RepID=A0A518CID0_9PLAN|nr:hypothetical protein [Polystyrenella longa]QDU78985.1 hypothetical protein Pla110_06890 [Polystyrenella longa]